MHTFLLTALSCSWIFSSDAREGFVFFTLASRRRLFPSFAKLSWAFPFSSLSGFSSSFLENWPRLLPDSGYSHEDIKEDSVNDSS